MIKFLKPQIERFGGFKLFRKYRKANRVSEFIKENNDSFSKYKINFFDHWKKKKIIIIVLRKINSNNIKNIPTFCLIHSKEINHEKNSGLNKRILISLEKVKFIIANSKFT